MLTCTCVAREPNTYRKWAWVIRSALLVLQLFVRHVHTHTSPDCLDKKLSNNLPLLWRTVNLLRLWIRRSRTAVSLPPIILVPPLTRRTSRVATSFMWLTILHDPGCLALPCASSSSLSCGDHWDHCFPVRFQCQSFCWMFSLWTRIKKLVKHFVFGSERAVVS
jgi:hypothetical protein